MHTHPDACTAACPATCCCSLEELQFALQELGVQGAQAQSAAAEELLQLASPRGSAAAGADADGTIDFDAFMELQHRVSGRESSIVFLLLYDARLFIQRCWGDSCWPSCELCIHLVLSCSDFSPGCCCLPLLLLCLVQVGLLQAITAVDHQQAEMLAGQHVAPASWQQQEQQQNGCVCGSMSDLETIETSVDDVIFTDAMAGSSRLTAGAAACRAQRFHGSSGSSPAHVPGRSRWGWWAAVGRGTLLQRATPVRAFVETSFGSTASAGSMSSTAGSLDIVVIGDGRGSGSGSSSSGRSNGHVNGSVINRGSHDSSGLHGATSAGGATGGAATRNGFHLADGSTLAALVQQEQEQQQEEEEQDQQQQLQQRAGNDDPPPAPMAAPPAGPPLMIKPQRGDMATADASFRGSAAAFDSAAAAVALLDEEEVAAWQAEMGITLESMRSPQLPRARRGSAAGNATWCLVALSSNPHRLIDAATGAEPPSSVRGGGSGATQPEQQQQQRYRRRQVVRLPAVGPCVIGAVSDR